jgi:hypothetical protein
MQFSTPPQIHECWELGGGDWMRHSGFTDSDSEFW